jgi:dTDP-4-amino-4,6-dideoxygalactose transaminase
MMALTARLLAGRTREILSLPIFPEMTKEDVENVIAAVREFFA